MVKIYSAEKEETQETQETQKTHVTRNNAGISHYKNKLGGNIILTETYSSTPTGENSFLTTSHIVIKNVHKSIDGTYISHYTTTDNQTLITVNYLSLTNNKIIKVTYSNNFKIVTFYK